MTADLLQGCYSIDSDYEVTTGCMRILPLSDIGTMTKAYTINGTTSEDMIITITASHPISVTTTTFSASETNEFVGVSMVNMFLVHHQSDIKATGTTGARSTEPTSTSNSAAIIAPSTSIWKGLGGALGVSFAMMVLDAAVVL